MTVGGVVIGSKLNGSRTGAGVLGRYELVSKLGSGGAAEVWLARHKGEGRIAKYVAIKRLRPDKREYPSAQARLRHEAEIGVLCQHPNIVGVLEFACADEPHIVLEHLHGVSLGMLLHVTRQQQLPIPRHYSAAIVLQVCGALDHLHNLYAPEGHPLSVVHCDVAPQNVVVTDSGLIKLIDFGIACSEVRRSGGSIEGHPGYIAPERLAGKEFDRRADIWAAGVLLRELLWHDVESGLAPRWLRRLGLRAPARRRLDQVAARATHENVELRYGTAKELGEALRTALGNETLARPNELSEWMQALSADELSRQRVLLGHRASRRKRAETSTGESTLPSRSGISLRGPAIVQIAAARRAPLLGRPAWIRSGADSLRRSLIAVRGRHTGLVWALAATLIVAQAVFIAFLLGGRAKGGDAPVFFSSSSAARTEARSNETPDTRRSSAVTTNAGPTTAQVGSVASIESGAETSPSLAPKSEVKKVPLTTDPSPQTEIKKPLARNTRVGLLNIDAMPFAQITIDGRSYGPTPILEAELRPGRHRVVARSATGKVKRYTVVITRGKTKNLRVYW